MSNIDVSQHRQSARSATSRLLTPRSVLVFGVSPRPGTLGQRVLGNIIESGYTGEIHLLGRQAATVHGLECVTSFDDLPSGIDLALFTAPAGDTLDMLGECVSHEVGSAVCYASGFAERGDDGVAKEAELGRLAREGGLGLVGPNCFGFLNTADRLYTTMAPIPPVPVAGPDAGPAVAVVAQSGSIAAHVTLSLGSRGVPISYMVTTGNEVGLATSALIEFFAEDAHTGSIAIYAEKIREPQLFRAAVRKAEEHGKSVVLLHPGRSARARAAVASHTGAVASDHAITTTMARRAGAVVVESLEELIDVAHVLLRYPQPPTRGTSLITISGALCAIVNDGAEAMGLDLPVLPERPDGDLEKTLTFTDVTNPLDLSTQPATQPEIMRMAASRMANEPDIGSVVVSVPVEADATNAMWLDLVLTGLADSGKPLIYVLQSEAEPMPQFAAKTLEHGIVHLRSPERALRAMARVTSHGRARAVGQAPFDGPIAGLPTMTTGPQPEWLGKRVLGAIGVPVPGGALAGSPDEAVAIAERVGYPVAAKAQAAALAHKSDVGGVTLGLNDEAQVRQAWARLHEAVGAAQPDIVLDGVLVEQMSRPGIELVVGGRRDPLWGPVLVIGSGGVLVELLDDVRLLPADLPVDAIVEEIDRLKVAKLLRGFRGSAPADAVAVAEVAARLGQLMLAEPGIVEVDINPLVVHERGDGVTALDALIVNGG